MEDTSTAFAALQPRSSGFLMRDSAPAFAVALPFLLCQAALGFFLPFRPSFSARWPCPCPLFLHSSCPRDRRWARSLSVRAGRDPHHRLACLILGLGFLFAAVCVYLDLGLEMLIGADLRIACMESPACRRTTTSLERPVKSLCSSHSYVIAPSSSIHHLRVRQVLLLWHVVPLHSLPRSNKSLACRVLGTFHISFIAIALYHYLVENFDNPFALLLPFWYELSIISCREIESDRREGACRCVCVVSSEMIRTDFRFILRLWWQCR
jgi:hypothetical protein